MAKIRYQPAYLKLADAHKRFRNDKELDDGLQAALREGTLSARGRLTSDFTIGADGGNFNMATEPSYSEPVLIPISAWRDWTADFEKSRLWDDHEHAEYADVEILRTDLEKLAPAPAGGRPQEHDWELILKQAIVWVNRHPIDKQTANLDRWIKELADSLPYCVQNEVPKDEALKRKLGDVFHAIVNGRPLPVGEPKRHRS